MGCTVDNLAADYRVCVVRGFRDARGSVREAREDGTIRRLDLDFGAGEIVIEWERGSGAREAMYFRQQFEPEQRLANAPPARLSLGRSSSAAALV